MKKLLFALFFLFIKVNNSYEINKDSINSENIELQSINTDISKTFFIKYLKQTIFSFNITEEYNLQINIHSINCNIDIDSKGTIKNQVDLNIYSLIINSNSKNITIKPKIDIIDGQFKENYTLKECPIIINSYYIRENSQQKLKIENKEENIFFCPSIYKL